MLTCILDLSRPITNYITASFIVSVTNARLIEYTLYLAQCVSEMEGSVKNLLKHLNVALRNYKSI